MKINRIWNDGKMTTELTKPQKNALQKARDLATALVQSGDTEAQPILDALTQYESAGSVAGGGAVSADDQDSKD